MTAMLEMRGVSKSFAGVQALRDVNFVVEAGQIHALVGENGAGKSTLMKVLSGVYPHGSYEGTIIFDGEERRFRDINDSEALAIIIIHQELALIPLMSIAENIFLSHPPSRLGILITAITAQIILIRNRCLEFRLGNQFARRRQLLVEASVRSQRTS